MRGLVAAAAAAAWAGKALSSSSELDPAARESAGQATGATAAAACAAAGRQPLGMSNLLQCVADPLACGGRAAASWRGVRCCWPAGAVHCLYIGAGKRGKIQKFCFGSLDVNLHL